MDRKRVLTEAKEKIEAARAAAGEYGNYIKLLPKTVKTGAERVLVEVPYMTVEGRVRMMVDEHKKAGQKFEIRPAEFIQAPDGKTLLARVTVVTMRGETTAHAIVNIGGSGVDSTNPYENAETSAVGRALGLQGYGTFGGGIASFEEAKAAMSMAAESPVEEVVNNGESPAPRRGLDVVSAITKVRIKDLLMKKGLSEMEAIKRISALRDNEEAQRILKGLEEELLKKGQEKGQEQAQQADAQPSDQALPAAEPEPAANKDVSSSKGSSSEHVKAAELLKLKKKLIGLGVKDVNTILAGVKTMGDLNRVSQQYGG